MWVEVLVVGPLDEDVLAAAADCLVEQLGLGVVRIGSLDPTPAHRPGRGQYDSGQLLLAGLHVASPGAARVLMLTQCDLCVPVLSFLFGHAQLSGRAAIVSTARLRQEFYGFPADPDRLHRRLRTEVLHEMGHTFGLVHCPEPRCPMSLASSLQHVDRKLDTFCRGCGILVAQALTSLQQPSTDRGRSRS
jgi:archaemetzincin